MTKDRRCTGTIGPLTKLRVALVGCIALGAACSPSTGAAAGGPAPAEEFTQRGLTYQHFVREDVPWSIHVLRIDRTRSDLQLIPSLGRGSRIGLGRLTEQLRLLPREFGTPVAAINGDFYRLEGDAYEGDPRGLLIRRGELISGPIERTCFWIDSTGAPQLGEVKPNFSVTWPNGENTPFGLNEECSGSTPVLYSSAVGNSTRSYAGLEFTLEKVSERKWLPLKAGEVFGARIRSIKRGGNSPIPSDCLVLSVPTPARNSGAGMAVVGDVLMISTASQPSLRGVQTALGGGPLLIHGGKATPGRANKSQERHPRSALGWNKDHFIFAEVDGRQPGLSRGMSVPELAKFMAQIGCEEAMNLDGGGSAELWVNGKIMNSPCFGRERNTATALVVVEKKGAQNED